MPAGRLSPWAGESQKKLGIAVVAVGLASFARAADLPTTNAPAPEKAKPNCLASVWDWLNASAADCPIGTYGITRRDRPAGGPLWTVAWRPSAA